MTNSRAVTEMDLRMPEFRNPHLKLEDLEIREDGKVVRKDRWESALRVIASRVGMPARQGWEIADIISLVEKVVDESKRPSQHGYVIQNKHGLYLSNGNEYEFIDSPSDAEYFESATDAQDYIVDNPEQLKGCLVKHAKAKLIFEVSEVPTHE